MSFTITIRDVADKDLGSLVASLRLPKGVDYKLTHMIDVQITAADPSIVVNGKRKKKRKNRRGNPNIKLTMTGKKPTMSGTSIEGGLELFERLEKKLGIGDVSALDFKNHLIAQGKTEGMLTRLVTEGYLDYL